MSIGIWGGLWAVWGGLGAPALAQDLDDLDDLDDFEFDEQPVAPEEDKKDDETETEEPETEAPADEAPPLEPDPLDDEELVEFEDPDADAVDLLEGDENEVEGDDDGDATYRATLAKVENLPPDAAIEEWRAYLATYPETIFRRDIEERIDALFDDLYAEGRSDPNEDPVVDAMREEIEFSQGLLLDNINPRQRIQGAFAFGAPTYIDVTLDYEHQFARRLSVHGGLRNRYNGFGFEVGPRFALVKSARTQTLLTLSVDARINGNPLYPSLRPVLGFGKKFGSVQLQAQAGADVQLRDIGGTTVQARYSGGAQVQWAPSDRVAVFAETLLYFNPQPADGVFDGGLFSFTVVSAGLTFYPSINPNKPDARNLEAKVGGSLPVASQYYQFYVGSINGQVNYFP